MPPLSLSGGARVEGGGGARPPPRTPLYVSLKNNYFQMQFFFKIDLRISVYHTVKYIYRVTHRE